MNDENFKNPPSISVSWDQEKIKTWTDETGKKYRPRILLTSVFGPYASYDGVGARQTYTMELFHNQVTRNQGIYSIRQFHNSWGIRMIQENISAPTAVLDFSSREEFVKELASHHYDIVGISSIIMNVGKVKEMCKTIRERSPYSSIVVGGHVAAIPDLENMIDADHIVKGDGISWMRRYLGEDEYAPINHPDLVSHFGLRVMGLGVPDFLLTPSAAIIPSVGCPMGCNFCTTSAFFGGKGRFVNFFKTGNEIYQVMCKAESALKTTDFMVMDENFLLQKKRTLELLEKMKEGNKSWSLLVFSSANALSQYSMEQLVELGLSYVWIGLESKDAKYEKLKGADTKKLVRELQENGIRVCGSSILGLEHHTPEGIIEEIEWAVSHKADLLQFALYTPIFGTELYADYEKRGLLREDVDQTECSSHYSFNFKHPHISREESRRSLDLAFDLDFERNGPSIYRISRTLFKGWMRHKNHPSPRVRRRVQSELGDQLKTAFNPFLWAMEQTLKKKNSAMSERMRALRLAVENEFGLSSRLIRHLIGPVVRWTGRGEEERLARGWTYEPRSFIVRKNWD